jgi:uncharacterized protein DUF6932
MLSPISLPLYIVTFRYMPYNQIWVDGSFVSTKVDPTDVDILLEVHGAFYDQATDEQKAIIAWVDSNLKTSHKVDSRAWNFYDRDNPEHWSSVWWRGYFLKLFGFYRDDGPNMLETKGMALIVLSPVTQDE